MKKNRSKKQKAKPEKVYINRELSWVEFNARVLDEGMNPSNPPLERLKFLSIVSSNFDEFFMVRVAALKRQERLGNKLTCPSGLRPSITLRRVAQRVKQIVSAQYEYLMDVLLPELAANGVGMIAPADYTPDQRNYVHEVFENQIFPTLTPLGVKAEGPLPLSGNLRLMLAFKLRGADATARDAQRLAIVPIPDNLDRMYSLPAEEGSHAFTMIEDVIVQCAAALFSGYEIVEHAVFQVTRDADLSVDEERDEDFLEAMQEVLLKREHSAVVRLAISAHSASLKRTLSRMLRLRASEIYDIPGPLDLRTFMSLAMLPGFDSLRDPAWPPQQPHDIPQDANLWQLLKERDVLIHRPYESFDPVVRLVAEAANDPNVLAIKMTLYRTSGDSPIIRALERAARNGKHVTVLVELKARFDEGRNIEWAQQLERVGAIVIYGIARLKVHSKAILIVRRERTGIVRYVHLGTGNYNDKTAKLYTDMGFMSTREDLSYDIALFFNTITGYSTVPDMRKLVMAPAQLRPRLVSLIQREIDRNSAHSPGLIMAKMNSLVDPVIIEKLCEASAAGVKIELNVRGICCVRPGVAGVSSNIRVVSIVDRFLEHSRIFYFKNGGNEEVYLSSADWMPRNLDGRVELMFPIEGREHKQRTVEALQLFFSDNVKSHVLQSDGTYRRSQPHGREEPIRCQEVFYRQAKLRASSARSHRARSFVVRRKAGEGNV